MTSTAEMSCDRIFTIKLGLSQSLLDLPKEILGFVGQKAHKTQLITLKTQ